MGIADLPADSSRRLGQIAEYSKVGILGDPDEAGADVADFRFSVLDFRFGENGV